MFTNGDLLYGRFRIGVTLPSAPPFELYAAKDEQDGIEYVIRCFPFLPGQQHNLASRVLRFVERRQKLTAVPWPRLVDAFVDSTYVYLQEEKPKGYGLEEWYNRRADLGYSERPALMRLLLDGLAELHSTGSDLYHGGFEPSDIVVSETGTPVLCGEKWSGQVIGLQASAPVAMRRIDLDSLAGVIAHSLPRDVNGSPAWDQIPEIGRAPVFLTRCMYECISSDGGRATDAAMLLSWITKLERACHEEQDHRWPEAAVLYLEAAKIIQVPSLQRRADSVQELSRPTPAAVPTPDPPDAVVPKVGSGDRLLPPKRKPSVNRFEASASIVTTGEVVRLTWGVDNAGKVDIQPGLGERQASGMESVPVRRTTTFVLTADGPGGQETRSLTVLAQPRPAPSIDLFEVTPSAIKPGGSAKLRWRVQNSNSATILPDVGDVDPTGEREVSPADTTSYQLVAGSAGASINRQATLTVTPPPRIESFIAFPLAPGTFRLEWKTTGAGEVDIQPGLGLVPASGQRDVKYAQPTTLRLAAKGPLGQHAEATVTAIGPPPPAPWRFTKWITFSILFLALAGAAYLLWNKPTQLWNKPTQPQTRSSKMEAGAQPGPKRDQPVAVPAQDSTAQPGGPAPLDPSLDGSKKGLSEKGAPRPDIQFGASVLEISRGQGTLLSWAVKGATEVLIGERPVRPPDRDEVPGASPAGAPVANVVKPSGSKYVSPDSTTEYKLFARYPGGETSQSVTINVTVTAPRILVFRAEPSVIAPGRTVVLSWTVEGANRVSLQPEPGMVEASGSRAFTLPATKKFTLVAEANGATPTQQDIWITVDPRLAPPADPTFSATPDRVPKGGGFTLRWQAQGATDVILELVRKPDQSLATLPPSPQPPVGQLTMPVDDQFTRYGIYEYKLTARYGSVTKEKHVSVNIVRSAQ